MLRQTRLNTGCWDTKVGHCFIHVGLGTRVSRRLGGGWEKRFCSQPCHCQTARKTTAAGETAAALAHQGGHGVSRLPPPCQRLLSLPLSSWKRLPDCLLPHCHLRCPSPRAGPRPVPPGMFSPLAWPTKRDSQPPAPRRPPPPLWPPALQETAECFLVSTSLTSG